ncbi:hypothetical protein AJ87_22965 [Rhizobium yanglingense]|nr:hypothetical protein AJ87_22965 [Rhizobium yanglingense]
MRDGHVLQEDAVFLQDEAPAFGEFVVLLAERIGCEAGAIGLIGGEGFDVVDAVGGRRGPLVGAEIADEIGTVGGIACPQARAYSVKASFLNGSSRSG